jgi:hypothetical protein
MAMLQGSRGLTPERRLANKRLKPTPPKTPIPSPREVSNIPLPSTSLNWSQQLAPSASRAASEESPEGLEGDSAIRAAVSVTSQMPV